MSHFRSSKMFVIVLVITIFATAAYAFAASNTMPATSNAGEGQVVIGGYTVSAVTYTYDTANPSQISTVSFTIAPGAGKASVSLTAGGLLQSCTGGGAAPHTTFTCNITGVSVLNATMLRVVASD
jgi:archaellin